ncbi:hypothetical protein Poli38472_009971 [Pythium oligandrum]|uniref:N-acetyltransferase domain-containing protein n=1 Tax=Pythium oligandrum TaxID=41045 RepID=A0A8K1FG73_PYTOL|nr:hypothetical protein Poli38472_009971 [Pythium oligandrum]|eukprot:TMW58412.1 hypothetical protein Poli38472_009971 [Pythium oligandrum]
MLVVPSISAEEAASFGVPLALSFRSYRPEDHAAVVDIFVAGMSMYCPEDEEGAAGNRAYIQWSLRTDMADIQGTYFDSGGHFWVLTNLSEGREEIIGTIALHGKQDGRGELRRLSVKREYRRHKLASKLVAHLEDWARNHGFTTVELNTGVVMGPACKLYPALGYTETGRRMASDDSDYELVFFEKALV